MDEPPAINLSLEQVERAGINSSGASTGYTEFSAGLERQYLLFDIDYREYEWEDSGYFGSDHGDDP